MEKLKDFIYESSDLFFGLIIVILIFWITGSHLYGWFQKDSSVYKDFKSPVVDSMQKSEDANQKVEQEEKENPSKKKKDHSQGFSIEVESAATAGEVADLLLDENVISSKKDFIVKLREMGKETRLKAGSFKIPPNSNLEDVINILTK